MDQRAKRNGECAGCPRGPFIRHFRCDIKPIANVCVTWRVRRRDSCPRNLSIVRGIISAAAAELWNYRPRGRLRARSRLADFARQLARCAQCDKSRQNRFLRFWSPPRKNSREISERRLVAILISTWKIPPLLEQRFLRKILLQVWSRRAKKPLHYIAVRRSSSATLLFIFLVKSIRNGGLVSEWISQNACTRKIWAVARNPPSLPSVSAILDETKRK